MELRKVEIPDYLLEDKEENYEEVFFLIRDPKDWRAEIAVRIPEKAEDVVRSAIEYYTATTIETIRYRKNGWVTIYAVGYRNGPAGP